MVLVLPTEGPSGVSSISMEVTLTTLLFKTCGQARTYIVLVLLLLLLCDLYNRPCGQMSLSIPQVFQHGRGGDLGKLVTQSHHAQWYDLRMK